MKKEFGAVEAAGSDREKTEGGFILPPGFMSWKEYVRLHPGATQQDDDVVRRVRWEPEADAAYVVSIDSEELRQYEALRERFAEETRALIDELKKYLYEHDVEVLLNPRSSKGLSARQQKLPKVKILLLPLFLRSALDEEKKKERMQGIPGVADCFLHFSEDGVFQLARFHRSVEMFPRWVSSALWTAILDEKDQITHAYQQKDFRAIAEIIGKELCAILRDIEEYKRIKKG
jgi:hypothetical protein